VSGWEWRAAASAFVVVFLAELGDKTQLATLLLASRARQPVLVFVGAALALVVSALLGVLLGAGLGRVLPEQYVRLGAGAAFIVLGILLVLGRP